MVNPNHDNHPHPARALATPFAQACLGWARQPMSVGYLPYIGAGTFLVAAIVADQLDTPAARPTPAQPYRDESLCKSSSSRS